MYTKYNKQKVVLLSRLYYIQQTKGSVTMDTKYNT